MPRYNAPLAARVIDDDTVKEKIHILIDVILWMTNNVMLTVNDNIEEINLYTKTKMGDVIKNVNDVFNNNDET